MELRVLRYFLAIAHEESISKAAQKLHITQPTLSRQLMDLEEELGKTLMIRSNKKITLTDEGMILKKRAEEILSLVDKTQSEIVLADCGIRGDIYIGSGETDSIKLIAKSAKSVQEMHPDIHFHIFSGDSEDVIEKLDNGILDFGLVYSQVDDAKYEYITVPIKDVWGVIMRKDSPLAEKEYIEARDLWDKPLIHSRRMTGESPVLRWLKKDFSKLNIVATYNLIFNASIMTAEGLGYTLGFDKLVNTSESSPLCFRPLYPPVESELKIVWKKYSVMTKPAAVFLEKLKEIQGD